MLSAMLQCLAIWRIAEYCGVGVVLQGPGVGRRAGRVGAAQRAVWRQCSAAIGCGRTVQSAPAPPPVHLSTAARTQQQPSSRTANSLQIWVSDRRTAPQPRTPPVQKPCKAAPHSSTLAASHHTTPHRDTEDFCDRWRWLVTLRDTRYNCDDDVTELQPAPPPSYHAVRNQVTSAN